MFGQIKNSFRPSDDIKELEKEAEKIKNKTSNLSYSERVKTIVKYYWLLEKQKKKEPTKE
jgi:hypothetical protein